MLHVVFILSVKASIFLEFLTKLLCPHQLVIPYINLFFCEPFFWVGSINLVIDQPKFLLCNQFCANPNFCCLTKFVPCVQLDKMDASARQKAEMAQKIAQELLKSSSHRLGSMQSMPALNSEQSNLVRAAQQKAAEIALQVRSCCTWS